ncbi:hypothetical protein DFJ74DRAFT_697225 [Hyaloraphidium curvatum]|nr:hypothetical protein DFJ74DRAFT_697225 [Hyaloraphidium curvatum]
MSTPADLPAPPAGFKYDVDEATGKVILDAETGQPKLVPVEAAAEAAKATAPTMTSNQGVGIQTGNTIGSMGAKSVNGGAMAMTAESATGALDAAAKGAPAPAASVVPAVPAASAAPVAAAAAAASAAPSKADAAGTSDLAHALNTDTIAEDTKGDAGSIAISDFVPDVADTVINTTKNTFNQTTTYVQNVFEDPGDAAQDALRGMSEFAQDFFKFISRGNVVDLAVGVIVGQAFTAIVNSLVNDMISPILGLIGNKSLSEINTVMRAGLSGNMSYPSPAQAKLDQAITLAWGNFLNTIINFFIIALVVFGMVKFMGLFYRKKETIVLVCFWCKEDVQADARRCGKCGSTLPTKEQEKAILALEKQVMQTLDSMKDATDLDKVAVESQLVRNRNAVMTGFGASAPVATAAQASAASTAANAVNGIPTKS